MTTKPGNTPKLSKLKHGQRAVKKVESKHDEKALKREQRKLNRVVKEINHESAQSE